MPDFVTSIKQKAHLTKCSDTRMRRFDDTEDEQRVLRSHWIALIDFYRITIGVMRAKRNGIKAGVPVTHTPGREIIQYRESQARSCSLTAS